MLKISIQLESDVSKNNDQIMILSPIYALSEI